MTLPRRIQSPIARLRSQIVSNAALLTNAGSMLATTAITSLLGAVFWGVAARSFSQAAVGVAGAAVAAMMLLGFLATMGLGTLLLGELQRSRADRGSMIIAALTITASVGALFGLGFAIAAPLVSANFRPLNSSWLATAFFAAGVGLTALAVVLDQALIGLLRGGLQLGRNTLFALVKLLALIPIAVLVAHAGSAWIYSAWVLGIATSLVVLIRPYLRARESPSRPNFAVLRTMRTSAVEHHALNLALECAPLVLPILVVALVSARANASFYVAWMIVGHLVMVPAALGTVLYPIGSSDAAKLAGGLRLTMRVSFAAGAAANLLLLAAASPLLHLFGSSYAAQGATPLHIMALALFPLTLKVLYVAVHRVRRSLASALPVVWAGSTLELGGAAIGAILAGLSGVAVGWLIAACLQGLMMSREVLGAMRAPEEHLRPLSVADNTLGLLGGADAAGVEHR